MTLAQVQHRLTIPTQGPGFIDVTPQLRSWLRDIEAVDGLVTVFIRHTSASLVIQENADPDVQADLLDALDALAPQDRPWRHSTEGAGRHARAREGHGDRHVAVHPGH